MERNASGLALGIALDQDLPTPVSYLETFHRGETSYLGKRLALPISLSELELIEAHIQSVAIKLSLVPKSSEFFLFDHG